jgi:hypothetical protein
MLSPRPGRGQVTLKPQQARKSERQRQIEKCRPYQPVTRIYRVEMVLPGAKVRLLVPGVMAR